MTTTTELISANSAPSSADRIRFTRTGLELAKDVTLEEWASVADKLGEASRSLGFIVGDWLVFGQDHFATQQCLPGIEVDPSPRRVNKAGSGYQRILAATGLDAAVITVYIYVARNVPQRLRSEKLSWEHHKAVARLPCHEQQEWLQLAESRLIEGETISTRRLRKSILAGRLLTPEELIPDPADRGVDNHIPFVNRLCAWWHRVRERKWLVTATPEQRETVKRDLKRVVDIYNQL